MINRIFYEQNGKEFIATGKIISEDDKFITIDDRYEGQIKIGKNYIVKIRNEGANDENKIKSR
jgi:hypothetical protein